MLNIKNVVIVGANGAVGKTVSGIFASFGNAKVYMLGRDIKKLEKAKKEAALSVKAITTMDNLFIDTLDNLEKYVKISDLVFESVSEDTKLKEEIHKKINLYLKKNTIVSTGTSGLSIDAIADCYDESIRNNLIGIHFFNPPYSLPLCELIPSKYNRDNIEFINDLRQYLNNRLLRNTIIVKNEPAFLANRIGFMFMNEALQSAEKFKDYGGIDFIDSILGCFTGRNMRPLETIDFVGLDVHKSIVDNVRLNSKENDKDSFVLPKFVLNLINNGLLGIKTGCGLYKLVDNKKMVYDINTNKYREIIKYNFYFVENAINEIARGNYLDAYNLIKNDPSIESNLCITFLLKYIIYSIKITNNICDDVSYCDIAMADGFNWVPPLALIDLLGGNLEVIKLCKMYLNEDVRTLLENLPKSKYDYRKFIKAKV